LQIYVPFAEGESALGETDLALAWGVGKGGGGVLGIRTRQTLPLTMS
jgi:hypothetical protein